MKRALFTAIGKPSEVVQLFDVDDPPVGPGQIAVRVRACPINPADLLRFRGQHAYASTLPASGGIEGAGVVEEVGEGVTSVRVGDVVAIPSGGTWCERFVTNADHVFVVPPAMDLYQAAMLSVNPMTAAGLLLGVPAGAWVIQNAANSAVGKILIRLAAQRGIHTINIVRREPLVAELKALGADVVLVGEDALASRVREATGGADVRLAIDAIAGEASGRLLECLGEGGRLVVYGLLSNAPVTLPAAKVVFGDYTVTGFSRLRALSQMGRAQAQAAYDELAGMVMSGALVTQVEAVYPFARIAEALEHAEREGRDGKILLEW